jgi:NADH-ubiquinone oxidoreductase chain 5
MAAPTPVSALVHSSTLVTAGIYILFRLSYFFPKGFLKIFLFFFAINTLFLGRLSAFVSFDRKKVIAFSTLRNLGLMGVRISLGCIGLRFFHLLTHGVRKALLFISTGNLMYNKTHIQDLRKFSKLWRKKRFSMLKNI